jgi:hypothetical protein
MFRLVIPWFWTRHRPGFAPAKRSGHGDQDSLALLIIFLPVLG